MDPGLGAPNVGIDGCGDAAPGPTPARGSKRSPAERRSPPGTGTGRSGALVGVAAHAARELAAAGEGAGGGAFLGVVAAAGIGGAAGRDEANGGGGGAGGFGKRAVGGTATPRLGGAADGRANPGDSTRALLGNTFCSTSAALAIHRSAAARSAAETCDANVA